jgi:hypothetical protein
MVSDMSNSACAVGRHYGLGPTKPVRHDDKSHLLLRPLFRRTPVSSNIVLSRWIPGKARNDDKRRSVVKVVPAVC